MKKIIATISFIVLIICFIFVGNKMADILEENPTYNGAGKIIVKETKKDTKAMNSVSAIVFDYRGYDTLGESIVLFTAVCGTTTVLRKNNKEENKYGK